MPKRTPTPPKQGAKPYDWLAGGRRPFYRQPLIRKPRPKGDGTFEVVTVRGWSPHGWSGPLPFPHVDLRYHDGRWHTLRADDERARRPWEHGYFTPDTDERVRTLVAELRGRGIGPAQVLAGRLAWEIRWPLAKMDFDRAVSWLERDPLWLAHPGVLELTVRAARHLRASSSITLGGKVVSRPKDKAKARARMRRIAEALLRESDAGETTARRMEIAREASAAGPRSDRLRGRIHRERARESHPSYDEMFHVPIPKGRPGRPRKKKP